MTDRPTSIRIAIADSDDETRMEMRRIVDRNDGFDVVGEAADGAELIALLRATKSDVLVVDMALGQAELLRSGGSGSSNGDRPRVLITTQRNDSRYVARALHAGAAGYLLKDRAYEELPDARRRLGSGGVVISAGIAGIERDV